MAQTIFFPSEQIAVRISCFHVIVWIVSNYDIISNSIHRRYHYKHHNNYDLISKGIRKIK